ncbi:lipase [Granulicella sp. S190]|uniref:lipase n=1 Tax=Granulicella sp. S190 TaxID=1747226 RepID=UPI00131BFA71|nr:lipase [Granulicella sp. S190]
MSYRIVRTLFALAALLLMSSSASFTQTPANTSLPIVFVHGNGDDASKWIGIIWLFESNNYPADKLYAVRFSHPNSRADDTIDEVNRSSTTDATAELSAFVTRVLIETHSSKVALIGSSRGGMTIRNYLLHGGSNNVAYAITCGTPNHGVLAMDTNLDGEFNGKGHYLQSLNHAYGDRSEVPSSGVKVMTLRSDKLDKYAQPTAISFGAPQRPTGVTAEGPALAGATNIVLPNLDHRELAFYPSAFAEMYKFITGVAPATTQVVPEAAPTLSGLITGFENGTFTNLPLAGAHLRIYPVNATESTTPAYEVITAPDGRWGPFHASPTQEYDFDLEFQGRHIRFYKAPIARSTTLLNLRLLPVPAEPKAAGQAAAVPPHTSQLLIARPEGYFSRERDPVLIDNKLSTDEPSGLPLNDAFLANLSTSSNQASTVTLRKETIVARPSTDLATDLPVVDFLW